MNQNTKRILTGLHQIEQENKIQPDRGKREKQRKEREEGMPFHLYTSLMACKATSGFFLF